MGRGQQATASGGALKLILYNFGMQMTTAGIYQICTGSVYTNFGGLLEGSRAPQLATPLQLATPANGSIGPSARRPPDSLQVIDYIIKSVFSIRHQTDNRPYTMREKIKEKKKDRLEHTT